MDTRIGYETSSSVFINISVLLIWRVLRAFFVRETTTQEVAKSQGLWNGATIRLALAMFIIPIIVSMLYFRSDSYLYHALAGKPNYVGADIALMFGANKQKGLSSCYGSVDVLKYPVGKGADVNAEYDGETALHRLVRHNSTIEAMEYLVSQGANVNAKNCQGETPLHEAAYLNDNRAEVIAFLISHGANVNAKDYDDATPLYVVAALYDKRDNSDKVIELLVSHGANIYEEASDGTTPFDILSRKRAIPRVATERIHETSLSSTPCSDCNGSGKCQKCFGRLMISCPVCNNDSLENMDPILRFKLTSQCSCAAGQVFCGCSSGACRSCGGKVTNQALRERQDEASMIHSTNRIRELDSRSDWNIGGGNPPTFTNRPQGECSQCAGSCKRFVADLKKDAVGRYCVCGHQEYFHK